MKAARILREKINSHKPTIGALATFHFWPGMVPLAQRAGLDYLIIDLEHLTHSQAEIASACETARLIDFPVLVRPPSSEMTQVRLAMDLGPCGLLVPYIESVADMDRIRDAVYMKPRGKRRPGGMGNFWVSDVNYATWKREVEENFIILPQIESKAGLAVVDDIVTHELTTAAAVGPYDLSADLGCCWEPTNPALQAALARIREAGKKAGKNMWMIGDGSTLLKQGYSFLCVAEPAMLLEGTLRGIAASLHAGGGATTVIDDRPLP